jgi:hypothetical protein
MMRGRVQEDDDWALFPKQVAFPWVIVAAMVGFFFGFMVAASAVPAGCFK